MGFILTENFHHSLLSALFLLCLGVHFGVGIVLFLVADKFWGLLLLLQLSYAFLLGLLERTHARPHICRHEYLDHEQPFIGFERITLFGDVEIALVGIVVVGLLLSGGYRFAIGVHDI